MKLLAHGTEVDGFVVRECIHAGGMALRTMSRSQPMPR